MILNHESLVYASTAIEEEKWTRSMMNDGWKRSRSTERRGNSNDPGSSPRRMHVQTAECTSRRDHGKQSKMNLTLLDTLFVILSWNIVYCAGAVVAFWIATEG